MLEICISVARAANKDYEVTLTERSDPSFEFGNPRQGMISAETFSDGFADLKASDGRILTPDDIFTAYDNGRDQLQDAKVTGEVLYRLITPGDVGERWREARKNTGGILPSVATLLELRAPEWANLPWEMLFDPHTNTYLFQNDTQTMGHAIPDGEVSLFAHTWPIRMLVVVGCRPEENIAWQEELRAIEEAASDFSVRLDLHILKPPESKAEPALSITVIKEELKKIRPHIFHFIGHGLSEDGGSLKIAEAENLDDTPWTLESLNTTMMQLRVKPRIVVLNACQGAVPGGELMISSTASAFTNCQCAAVIAMRGDVRGIAATIFSQNFYKRLAEYGIDRVDRAYAGAVTAIADDTNYGMGSRSWTLPRIFYSRAVSNVFPVDLAHRPCCGFSRAFSDHADLKDLQPFVNQLNLRREVFYETGHEDPDWETTRDLRSSWFANTTGKRKAMVVRGEDGSGKSWFLRACTYMAKLEGYEIFYCNFRSEGEKSLGKTKDFRFLLEMLLRHAPANGNFFDGSLHGINITDGPLSGFVRAAQSFRKSGGTSASTPGESEDVRESIMEKLHAGLRALSSAPQGPRLFLAFDNIDGPGGIEAADWVAVVNALIKPVSFERKSPIRIAVSVNRERLKEYHFDSENDYFMPKPLELLPKEEYPRLARYYCHRRPELKETAKELVVNSFAPNGNWALSKLEENYRVGCIVHAQLTS